MVVGLGKALRVRTLNNSSANQCISVSTRRLTQHRIANYLGPRGTAEVGRGVEGRPITAAIKAVTPPRVWPSCEVEGFEVAGCGPVRVENVSHKGALVFWSSLLQHS